MTLPAITLQANPNVVMTKLDERSAILLHLRTKQYYTLNETGIRIWELIHAGHGVDEIAATLQTEYNVQQEEATRSVSAFCESLRLEDLLQQRANGT